MLFGALSKLYALNSSNGAVTVLNAVNPMSLALGLVNTATVTVGGRVLFIGADAAHGSEMWSSDGTAAGTFMLQDADPGTASGLYRRDWAVIGNSLYYIALTGASDEETRLFVSDGTVAGTHVVSNAPLNPGWLSAANGTLYFIADGDTTYVAGTVFSYVPGGGMPGVLAHLPEDIDCD